MNTKVVASKKKKNNNYTVRGEVIGREGGVPGTCGAGFSTGAHLHFEVRRNGATVNPRDYLGTTLSWPMAHVRVSQEFGWTDYAQAGAYNGGPHTGIDLVSTDGYGASVHATGTGLIIFNGISGGYGHLVIIDHGGGLRTYYGHLICS
ncbi:MAG: peptidoglycan DD-metalloendopeptidase family protein [Patescibacteria group bacterium]